MRPNREAAAALAAGSALLLVGGGAALAASGDGDRGTRCDERLAKIAERRGVTAEQLQADLKARLLARIEAAEKAGRISSERAAALRTRVSEGSLCGRRHHVRARIVVRGMVRAAAGFLKLDRPELRAQLPGTSSRRSPRSRARPSPRSRPRWSRRPRHVWRGRWRTRSSRSRVRTQRRSASRRPRHVSPRGCSRAAESSHRRSERRALWRALRVS